jgi:hypothetical protein
MKASFFFVFHNLFCAAFKAAACTRFHDGKNPGRNFKSKTCHFYVIISMLGKYPY